MMTSSNGNIFRVTGPLWGEPSVTSGFPSQKPVTRTFDAFFDLRMNKRLSKQPRCQWFETPSRSLWRYCNMVFHTGMTSQGLPYIPRVHLSEGSFVRSPLRWLCSEEPMVRRSFIPKFLYSESCYVPKIPYSERPPTIWILCYEGSLVRSSSSPKVLCSELPYSENRPSPIRVLYYEGPFVRSPSSSKIAMFRRFYLPNVARSIRIVCCEGSLFWKF